MNRAILALGERIAVIIFILLLSSSVSGQSIFQVDSLRNALIRAKEDTVRIRVLLRLSKDYNDTA